MFTYDLVFLCKLSSDLDNKGFTYIPHGDSTFTIAYMPPRSYSYVAATRFTDPPADDLDTSTYCTVICLPANSGNITTYLFYSRADKRLFHGFKISQSSAVSWMELANKAKVEEYSASNASNASLNILDRSHVNIPANSNYNGITYNRTGEGVYHLSGVVSTGNTQSFYNLITSLSTLVGTDFHPGDRVQVKISGNPNKVGLRVYLYPNTLPQRDITYTKDGIFVIPDTCTGILVRLNVSGEGTDLSQGYDVKCGLYLCPTHDDVAIHYKSTQEIKILVFGSSFSYSTLGYLPAMMNSIDPDVKITMGICYDSGQTVAGHISRFDNQTKYTTYSEYVPSSNVWSRWSATYTPQNILSRHKWDYVVIQQACRSTTEPISQVETFANKIQGYISYNTCFLFNMAQVLGANSTFPARYTQATGEAKSAAMYQEMAAYASALNSGYIVSDILPCGTAVQNARTSSLKSLGTVGEEYLCYDDNGHLCNGLPMMIGSITACYKLLSIVGRKPKIWETTFVPTDAWKIQDNVPMGVTSYGSCIGTTPENILLAKKCALAAIKHPFEVTDFSSY